MKNLNEFISTKNYFKYSEFTRSDVASRLGINNIPKSEDIWNRIQELTINCLDPIREYFGKIRILSGYRTPTLCKKIGSTSNSNHTRGEAADIEPIDNSIKLIQIFNWIFQNLEFRELILEYAPMGWIHIAYRKNENIKQLKLKDKSRNYKIVSIEYINKLYLGC